MKKELTFQLLILGAAVCLLLVAMFRQRSVQPVEVPNSELIDLIDEYGQSPARERKGAEEISGPTPTPFPSLSPERETEF